MLDTANGIGDLDGIADGVLVFEDDVETGDDVADEVLRSEAEGQAGKSSDSSDRGDVDPEFLGDHEERKRPNDFAGPAVDDGGECASLLLAGLSGFALGTGGFDDQLGDQLEQMVDEQRDDDDAKKMEKIRDRQGRKLR